MEQWLPYRNSLKSHFPSESSGQPSLTFDIDVGIVEKIIGGMIYSELDAAKDIDNSDDDESVTDEVVHTFEGTAERKAQIAHRDAEKHKAKLQAMSIFVKAVDNQFYTATIPKTKNQQFELSIESVACGASFRLTSKMIERTCQVMSLPTLRSCTRQSISSYIRTVSAVNLQRISSLLKQSWAFSIALDSATHFGTSYLDIRFRFYIKEGQKIVNLHGCTLPMYERHTGDVIAKMTVSFLDQMCPNWRVSLISATSDGAANMTGRFSGAITRIQQHLHAGCDLFRIWCGAHQLDLVMEYVFKHFVRDAFFTGMTDFILHLTCQHKLIHAMGTTCPHVVNRWLSTDKVTMWFKSHRPEILDHIQKTQPITAPSTMWWIYLLAMDCFTSHTAATFRKIQGLTTLVCQQQEQLYELIDTLMEQIDATGPHTQEERENMNHNTNINEGGFMVKRADVKEFLIGLSSWVEELMDDTDEEQLDNMIEDIGRVFLSACKGINSIMIHRKNDNTPQADPQRSLPPVLPHELVRVTAANFIRKARQQGTRLQKHFGVSSHLDIIADEHKALLAAYRHEEVLAICIDGCDANTSFECAWALLSGRFPHLAEFCGGVASIFPSTSTVESDFSVLRWEKDDHRKSISDFGLEGVMQSKQYNIISKLIG